MRQSQNFEELTLNLGLEVLREDEAQNIDGGEIVALTGAAAIAAGAGIVIGAVIVGAAVGYGVYKLVDWATD